MIPQKGKNPRRLTPRECARLQGYPDSFFIPVSDTQAYKQFGNSVCVPLMKFMAEHVLRESWILQSTSSEKVYRPAFQVSDVPDFVPA